MSGQPDLPMTMPRVGRKQRRFEVVFADLHARGFSLAVLCDKRHLNRTPGTLKRYARRLGLAFPDYSPRSLKAGQ